MNYTPLAWAGGTSHASRGLEELEKKVLVVCLAGARSLLRPEKKRDRYYDRKKKSSSRLSGKCAIAITTGKKKVLVVFLAGARSLLRLEKTVLVVCLAGARSLLRPEKKG